MTVLDVMDDVRAGKYRSDRFPSVPFTTLTMAMQHAQDVLAGVADKDHDGLLAGVITPSCSDRRRVETVSHRVGVGLRIGGEAGLCFTCGPDGGHYHPGQGETMDSVMRVAERLAYSEETE